MIKLFKLIYINLLEMFDISKYKVLKDDGIDGTFESKFVTIGILFVAMVFLIYSLLGVFKFDDLYRVFSVGYMFSFLALLLYNFSSIEGSLFKNDDNDILLSLPLSRYQIIFSKIFNVYIKNFIISLAVMLGCFIFVYKDIGKFTDLKILSLILNVILLPILPIVLSTLIVYFNDSFKIKYDDNLWYRLSKYGIIFVFIGLLFLVVKFIGIKNFVFLNPFTYLFYKTMKDDNILCLLSTIILSILVISTYFVLISNNYLRMCSILKGVKSKKEFVYKDRDNEGQTFGLILKEFSIINNNKLYKNAAFKNGFNIGIVLIVLAVLFKDYILKIENVNVYIPVVLGVLISSCCSTISSISLEKENLVLYKSLPIPPHKILLAKYFTNVSICSFIILLFSTVVSIGFRFSKMEAMFTYLVPFAMVLMISLLGLLLDCRFREKHDFSDAHIIRERFILFVPGIVSIFMLFLISFFPMFLDYEIIMGAFVAVQLVIILILLLYFVLNRKRLYKNLG